ncbi:MAG TPA: HAMP domain-containing sensor histidine kinase [Polyangiaceae bacterium]|nr:HAMP domain-containing sensor histidine kinase [Polyangiaceae bacterium]
MDGSSTEGPALKRPASLRSTLALATVFGAVLAVLVSGAVVALTSILHHTTIRTGNALRSVRLTEGAEIDLLLHGRALDPIITRDIEGDLRTRLREARRLVVSEEEARVLTEAEGKVEAYIAASHDPDSSPQDRTARQQDAYEVLERLIAINIAQSSAAQREAARWSTLGSVIGFGGGALVIVVSGALLVWVRGRAFAPIFSLAEAMERFAGGDFEARAPEHGARELSAMCARFNEMASALTAQREARIAFLGGVAHDLRNPLSALRMAVGILRLDGRRPSEEQLRRMAEKIDRQITRMERMLGDFLEVARIEAGQLEIRSEVHDARTLVEEVVSLFEGASQEHQLTVRLPDVPLYLDCDPLRIEQVLINLVSNAIKYSPAGSPVEVALEANEAELELRVTDRGVGIAEHDRERIFEPFRRVGLSQQTIPGVGLGLFVVRKIVEAHHGRIELESARGRGSTFRVFLPRRLAVPEGLSSSFEDTARPLH